MSCCSIEESLRHHRDIFLLRRRGYGPSHMHVDDHVKMLIADEDGVNMSLRRTNLEARSREQGEGVNLQLY